MRQYAPNNQILRYIKNIPTCTGTAYWMSEDEKAHTTRGCKLMPTHSPGVKIQQEQNSTYYTPRYLVTGWAIIKNIIDITHNYI